MQPITGILSGIYKFYQNNFLCTVADAVHPAHPFQLVSSFQGFSHTFLLCHSRNDDFHSFIAGLISLGKMPMQRSARKIVCIKLLETHVSFSLQCLIYKSDQPVQSVPLLHQKCFLILQSSLFFISWGISDLIRTTKEVPDMV